MTGARIIGLLLVICLTGCLASKGGINRIQGAKDVFGIELYSATDYREIKGVKGTDEPCLKGFERSFDALGISIGYGFDGKIRKITTRNPETTLFGVHPGTQAKDAGRTLLQAGLTDSGTPGRYTGDGLTLTLLVDGSGRAFGITVETDN
ncbi:MAG: hypothetical protein JJE30_12900 [Desulfuromonadales bacterium]|nr:hypothetical protein [Desulfuromonadales bacterium]